MNRLFRGIDILCPAQEKAEASRRLTTVISPGRELVDFTKVLTLLTAVCYPSNFQERRVTRVVRKGGGNESDESDDERGEVEEVEVEGREGEGSGPSETGTYTVEEKEDPGNQV